MIIYRNTVDKDQKKYNYTDKNGKSINDRAILKYIDSLVIPPAYHDVQIFYEKSPKIVYQGLDNNNRLQQIYSKKWRESADKAKFKALIDFGKKLPIINTAIKKNIKLKNSKEKIIAIILRIIICCGFRVGQMKYYDMYGSIGLSTLMKKHLTYKPTKKELHISFPGKKGVINDCIIKDEELIKELLHYTSNKANNDFLFTYTEDGINKNISAIDVNNWLKEYNPEFTSKFFRNYFVNILLLDAIKNISTEIKFGTLTELQRKKIANNIIKDLACSINNTPTICKKSYIDLSIIEMFIKHPRKYAMEFLNNNRDSNSLFISFLEKKYK